MEPKFAPGSLGPGVPLCLHVPAEDGLPLRRHVLVTVAEVWLRSPLDFSPLLPSGLLCESLPGLWVPQPHCRCPPVLMASLGEVGVGMMECELPGEPLGPRGLQAGKAGWPQGEVFLPGPWEKAGGWGS